jgi:general secretion pathway protein I
VKSRGFTLIEMLVALAILAIALAATQRAMSGALGNAYELRQRLLAGWVAENRLAELRASRALPALGETAGEEQQAGITFHWRVNVGSTPNAAIRRVEVRVLAGADDAHALSTLVGYLGDRQ